MITLIVWIVRLALIAVFAFGFVVLFEHGWENYPESLRLEWTEFSAWVGSQVKN